MQPCWKGRGELKDFVYLAPASLEVALRWLEERAGLAWPMAGGTDLLVRMKDNLIQPHAVIDLTRLEEIRFIREVDGMIQIGAAIRHSEAASSPLLRDRAPLLAEACSMVGSWQIRNMGTLAGNLCNASPAADTVPPLLALGAEVVLASHQGQRSVAVENFSLGPGKTCLVPGELVIRIQFRPPPVGAVSFFQRVGQRRALAIAKCSLAFVGSRSEGPETWRKVRIALGAVAPTVIRAHRTEEFLIGKPLRRTVLEEAARIVEEEARPIADIRSTVDYRRRVTGNMLVRGLWSLMKEE
jgi:CO/xanthine dehydrogenase FAD-binding subunit